MELFIPYLMVDEVERFVIELTRNQWLYRHYVIRRFLFISDRFFDLVLSLVFLIYIFLSVYGFVCLVIYIIFRLISLVLCFTKLCKCNAVRTIIPVVSSVSCSLCAGALFGFGPEFDYDAVSLHCVVRVLLTFLGIHCLFHEWPIFFIVRRLTFVDEDIFLHEVKSNVTISRSFVMFWDGSTTILSTCLLVITYQVSVSWFVCLIICIILRLISFKLSYNTKPYKFYAKWTFNAWAISILLCLVTAFVSLILNAYTDTCLASKGNHTLPPNSTYVNSSLQYMEREYLDFTLTTISSSFYDNSSQNSLYS